MVLAQILASFIAQRFRYAFLFKFLNSYSVFKRKSVIAEREKDHVIKIVVEDSLTAVKVMELAIEEGWSRAAILHPGQSDGVTQAMIHDFNSLSSPLAIITHAHPSGNNLEESFNGFFFNKQKLLISPAGALMPHGTLRVLWFDFPVKWQEVYYYHYYSLASLILLCATRSDRDRSRIGNMATQCLKVRNCSL